MGMMCEMHDLIVISWKDHHKANQPAKEHIYPPGGKNGGMAQLMLRSIEKIEQNTQDTSGQPDPGRSHSQTVQVTGQDNCAQMTGHLHGPPKVRACIERLKFGRRDQLSA